jgi:hypothetical protein
MDQDKNKDTDIEFDRICQNCGSFFQDSEDLDAFVCR